LTKRCCGSAFGTRRAGQNDFSTPDREKQSEPPLRSWEIVPTRFSCSGSDPFFVFGIYQEKTSCGTAGLFEHLRDGVHRFTCELDGKKWQHSGKLANGNEIDEVWERVE
jgi:hypothetical protein